MERTTVRMVFTFQYKWNGHRRLTPRISTAGTDENIEWIYILIHKHRRRTIDVLGDLSEFRSSTNQRLNEIMGMKRVASKSVLRVITCRPL